MALPSFSNSLPSFPSCLPPLTLIKRDAGDRADRLLDGSKLQGPHSGTGKQRRKQEVVPVANKCNVVFCLVQVPSQSEPRPTASQDHDRRAGIAPDGGCVRFLLPDQGFQNTGSRCGSVGSGSGGVGRSGGRGEGGGGGGGGETEEAAAAAAAAAACASKSGPQPDQDGRHAAVVVSLPVRAWDVCVCGLVMWNEEGSKVS